MVPLATKVLGSVSERQRDRQQANVRVSRRGFDKREPRDRFSSTGSDGYFPDAIRQAELSTDAFAGLVSRSSTGSAYSELYDPSHASNLIPSAIFPTMQATAPITIARNAPGDPLLQRTLDDDSGEVVIPTPASLDTARLGVMLPSPHGVGITRESSRSSGGFGSIDSSSMFAPGAGSSDARSPVNV